MRAKKKVLPLLNVVFDTNVLFTDAAHFLLRNEVKQVIEKNSTHPDLTVKWYLPTLVIDERRYQMQQRAFELLPYIGKLERLLGNSLNVTEETLVNRVNEAVTKQITQLGVAPLELKTVAVDWGKLINCSVFRKPPFDPGGKEKGFRDSLIAESFFQIVHESPATPSVCRLAFVTNDELLARFLTEGTNESKNVRILSNVGELESLINTLVSQVSEEFVAEWSEKAMKYFFQKDDLSTLYYRAKIREKIAEQYKKELLQVPKEPLMRESGTWWIAKPVFVKKDGQRIYWSTPIEIDAKLFRFEFPQPTASAVGTMDIGGTIFPTATLGDIFAQRNKPPASLTLTLAEALAGNPLRNVSGGGGFEARTLLVSGPTKVEVGSGKSFLEIHWSVSITQTRRLTSPRVEKIQFVSTKWSEGV
jgi:hypothetical protein